MKYKLGSVSTPFKIYDVKNYWHITGYIQRDSIDNLSIESLWYIADMVRVGTFSTQATKPLEVDLFYGEGYLGSGSIIDSF